MLLQDAQRIDADRARSVVREHPWAVLVSAGPDGLLASHMPAVVDETADGFVILSHTARADPQAERILAGAELLLVFQGEHGYLPGAWAGGHGASTGTWNFEAVPAHGGPEPLARGGPRAGRPGAAGPGGLARPAPAHLRAPRAAPRGRHAVGGGGRHRRGDRG